MEGRGVDRLGGPQMMRYQHDDPVVEIAVLVGDYEKVDDAGTAQKTLKKIKYMKPDVAGQSRKNQPDDGRIHAIQRRRSRTTKSSPKKGRWEAPS